MFDDKGPLLYIDSVSTDAQANNQTVFDSRAKKIITSFTDYKKLNNIISMYQRDKPVYCKLYTNTGDLFGFPTSFNNSVVTVKTNDGKLSDYNLSEIKDIEIINFY